MKHGKVILVASAGIVLFASGMGVSVASADDPAIPVTGYEHVEGVAITLDGSSTSAAPAAYCPTGKVVVGGGFRTTLPGSHVTNSYPIQMNVGSAGPDTWFVTVKDVEGVSGQAQAYAICVDGSE